MKRAPRGFGNWATGNALRREGTMGLRILEIRATRIRDRKTQPPHLWLVEVGSEDNDQSSRNGDRMELR